MARTRTANPFEGYRTALAAVVETPSVRIAAHLLQNGAMFEGSGAITAAAKAGMVNIVEVLLERGAAVDEIGIYHPRGSKYDEDTEVRFI